VNAVKGASKWPIGSELSKPENWRSLLFAVCLSFGAVATLAWKITIAAVIIAVATDTYSALLLIEAALRSDKDKSHLFKLPHRIWSVPVLFLLVCAFVCSFGSMYLASEGVQTSSCKPDRLVNPVDAAYFSAVTITTLGYGDFVPVTTRARLLVMAELASGALLLLVAFPVLASRLALIGRQQDGGEVRPQQ
jgi:voltage-gated potassium channel Kch